MKTFSRSHKRVISTGFAITLMISLPFEGMTAELPIQEVILYKHGIGYFERAGTLKAGDEGRLDFKASEMNDVLKSLTVVDRSGAKVNGVRYDSNESIEQKLSEYPFQLGDREPLSSFLDSVRGSKAELKLGDRTYTGTILSARTLAAQQGDERNIEQKEQIVLLLDSGQLTTLDLAATSSITLLDTRLQEQLKQYLQDLAQSKSKEKRSVYIDSAGSKRRDLVVSYIAPAPIWKSSYRLIFADSAKDGGPTLEGWAIVDNTTGEDWNNVKLSVVSGRPISFISQLDTPRYGNRQVAELPEDRAAGPVVYGGAVATESAADARAQDNRRGVGTGAGGGVAGGVGGVPTAAPPPAAKYRRLDQFAQLQSVTVAPSTVDGATGATLGELFQYNFAGPITVKKSQSAMLPFLQDKVNARKLLIYSESNGTHPVNAAEITNSTAKTLDGGPITVYDAGAYAGEALVETVKAGDKRLIGYGVDYGTRITTAFNSGDKLVREIHAKNGILRIRSAIEQSRTYTIKNVDAKAKTLIIEQPGRNAFNVISPSPTERTANAYRFEVKLAPNGSETLPVKLEQLLDDAVAVSDITPDLLVSYVHNKSLSETGRKQLEAIATIKQQIVQLNSDIQNTEAQINDLNTDLNRIRQNIDSLNRVSGQQEQVQNYSRQLAQQEAQIAKLRDQARGLQIKKSELNTNLRGLIDKLDF